MRRLSSSAATFKGLAVMVPFAALLLSTPAASAQVSLGGAENFAVLGGSAVTCTDCSVVGDVGVNLGGAITQTNGNIAGALHEGDTIAQQAHDDLLAAYVALAAEPCGTFLTGFSGQTLRPGVYCVEVAATETGGVLTLAGTSADTWIFKIGTSGTGALTGTNFSVIMPGAEKCNNNVIWWTADAATLTDSTFIGSILAGTAVTVTRGTMDGQALANAVTLTGPAVCARPSASN